MKEVSVDCDEKHVVVGMIFQEEEKRIEQQILFSTSEARQLAIALLIKADGVEISQNAKTQDEPLIPIKY